jgi:hypothetical protein
MSTRPAALEIGPINTDVAAPAALVFQMLGAIGQGAQRPGERAEIVERDGDALVADFWTVVTLPFGRSRSVRTREAVRLVPPDRIEYEHLDGPVRGLLESITVEPLGDRLSRLVYRGAYVSDGRLPALLFRLVSRPAVERAVRSHFVDLAARAEARAARSRQFRAATGDEVDAVPTLLSGLLPESPPPLLSPAAAFGHPAVVPVRVSEPRGSIE